VGSDPRAPDIGVRFVFSFIYYLFIYSSYSMEPEGYGRYRKEIQQHKLQNRCAKASALTRQRKSSTGPPPAPIHPCSVVPEKIIILGDSPSQEHRH